MRSGAAWIASAPEKIREQFLDELKDNQLLSLPYLFDFWALPHQLPPKEAWHAWVVLGGRGAGKTRAGAEWVRAMVEGSRPHGSGAARRVALIGETLDQGREIMVFGESGIMACSPPDRRPDWLATRRMLRWPNGAVAQLFSAHDPEALRGPQFDAAWLDEMAKWKRAEETLDMLLFGLRLGDAPRFCVTTTPRNRKVLRGLLERESTVTTHAPTSANRAHLATSFLREIEDRYGGTRLGRQELDGLLLNDVAGALWTGDMLADCLVGEVPELDRIVVAVDPPVTGHADSDACGIVVAGATYGDAPESWRAYVIEDATVGPASPATWARRAVQAVRAHGADRLVAEVNQGGALVESVIRGVDPLIPFRSVHATRSKGIRAEPVAALYEQGRVYHLRGLGDLEDQMALMTPTSFGGDGSPDRVDALVWALTDLMIEPARNWCQPSVRTL